MTVVVPGAAALAVALVPDKVDAGARVAVAEEGSEGGRETRFDVDFGEEAAEGEVLAEVGVDGEPLMEDALEVEVGGWG